MRRILFITLEYPPQRGGVASYYGGLVEELKRQGHEMEVISGGPSSGHPEDGPLLYRWIWPRWLKGYFLVRKKLKIYGDPISVATEIGSPAITLFVGHVLPLGTVAYLLRRRVPYVVFTHGMDVLMAQRSWRKRWLAKEILGHAKLVVTNSEFTKNQVGSIMSDRTKQTPVFVVYPCPAIKYDVRQEDVEALRRRLGLTGKKVLLTLGRVVERKGHDMVIRALPEILRQVPNVVYVVAGDGPYLEKLQKMVIGSPSPQSSPIEGEEVVGNSPPSVGGARGGGLQPAVRFVGEVSDEERLLYYAMCDLFVMPARQIGSDVEGFGLSFLEAAVFGKPSVGGRSGGVSEAIWDGKTGKLVDPADAGALAQAVVQILRDEVLREQLGRNAKTRVGDEFTWVKQVEKLSSILEKSSAWKNSRS